MDLREAAVGVLLAGGRSSRMGGGDKCLLPLAGRPILALVIERLRSQPQNLIINANGDVSRFAEFELPIANDRMSGFAGPLAGVHAGMDWARNNRPDCSHVITAATDTPFFPADLVARFGGALGGEDRLVIASSKAGIHPVFGVWPLSLQPQIEESLQRGERKVTDWVRRHNAREVEFPPVNFGDRKLDPFFNINRPEDLAEADALLGGRAV
jgi:molybdopterin-guanine dinucleotide biosynthesis protein A